MDSINKIIEKLMAEFTVASDRKKKEMAKKYGYDSPADFLLALQESLTGGSMDSNSLDVTDMVVAFDTTGSMASYIHSVRNHIKELIPKMFKDVPNLKMKIVAFGDYCDMDSTKVFGDAYQETSLTDNQADLIKFVQTSKDTSGGDADEFYELVIKKITEETPWRNGKRSVLLIADYTPHKLGYSWPGKIHDNQIDWKVEAKAAAKLGIQFDTLKIIPRHTWYDELSKITGGACMDFANVTQIHNVVMGSTYARGNKSEFTTLYRSAVEKRDTELVGALKTMSMTNNFSSAERDSLDSLEKTIMADMKDPVDKKVKSKKK